MSEQSPYSDQLNDALPPEATGEDDGAAPPRVAKPQSLVSRLLRSVWFRGAVSLALVGYLVSKVDYDRLSAAVMP